MSFFPGTDPAAGDAFACDTIENLIIPRSSDIGGFSVRRALPSRQKRLVGSFIFSDRMGPAMRTGRFDIVPGDEEEFVPLPAV